MGINPVLQTGLLNQSSAQVIDGSLRFDDNNKNYLTRTLGTAGNNRTFTFSTWTKGLGNATFFCNGVAGTGDNGLYIMITAESFYVGTWTTSWQWYVDTNRLFRDDGWYHLVVSVDTTQSTPSDRVKLYVNGVQETSFATANYPSENYDTLINNTAAHAIGRQGELDSHYLDKKLSQVYFIDGQQLGPENFGFTDPLTNTWRPKKFSGSFTGPGDNVDDWIGMTTGTQFNASTSIDEAFDGVSNSFAAATTSGYFTFTPRTPITGITNVRLTVQRDNSTSSTIELNDVDISDSWSAGTTATVTFARTTLSKVKWGTDGSNQWFALGKIEVEKNGVYYTLIHGKNGFYLPMDGNSPIGEDKSGIVTPNNGSIWSASLASSSGFRSSEPRQNAFDGDTSSICSAVGSGTITFTSPVTFASNSTIRVFLHGGDHTVTVNGGSNQTISAGSFQTVTYSNSGNANFVMTFHRGGGADTGVRAIEINGVILTDNVKGNSWTPVNFGGSVELDKATGALPILNTTQGGTQAGVGVFGSLENEYYTVTTANGSVYQFDITSGDNPSLEFIRGATYRFDYTSHASHPLRFSSTNPDSSTTAYTTGTNTSVSNVITITVPHDAPDTLYYYCTAHASAMNGAISVTTDNTKADQYAANCVLALPLVGSTNDVSNQINSGSTTKIATSSSVDPSSTQSNFYAGSHHWSANSDTLQYAQQGDELVFGTGDFTIELWFYDDDGHNGGGGGRCYLFDNRIGGSVVGDPPQVAGWVDNSNEINLGAASTIEIQNVDTNNRWIHYAAVRSSGTVTLYIDGVAKASISDTTDYPNNGIGVGRATDGGYGWAGYIQDFRVYKGVAKYTSNFIPASTKPDILPDTPSGVSGSSKLTKITDGAVSFDGTGDYLSVADSDDFDLAGNNWTIEAFVYHSNTNYLAYEGIMAQWALGSGTARTWTLETVGSGATSDLEFYYYDTSNNFVGPVQGGTLSKNRWHHVAACRSGNTIRMFIDGVMHGSGTSISVNIKNSTDPLTVGGGVAVINNTTGNWNGFISNARLVNGTALYTSNFTPPSAPLTNVTNTKLLCCQSNTQEGAATTSPNMGGINNGTQWSSYLTPSDNFTASGRAAGFDGSTGTWSQPGDNSSSLTFAPPGGITYSTSVEVYTYQSNGVFTTVSDGAQSVSWTTLYQGWKTIASGGGTFTSTVLTSGNPSANDSRPTFAAIRVDGTILVDPLSPYGDATATNFNPFNTNINTVRGQETGYCTLNPLDTIVTLKDGNLETSTSSGWQSTRATIGMKSGKFYWETQNNQDAAAILGISNDQVPMVDGEIFGSNANPAWTWAGANYYFNSSTAGTGLSNHGTSDIVQYAFDADNGNLWFGRNGIWYNSSWATTGDPANGLNPTVSGLDTNKTYFACASFFNGSAKFNFGQKPFKFPPPDGFQPINAANVRPETVIARPDQYVGVKTYTGDSNPIPLKTGFSPDLVFIKSRTSSTTTVVFDSVRGLANYLQASETDQSYSGGITQTFVDGYLVPTGAASNNGSSNTYVTWTWKAGGSKGTFNIDGEGYANASDVNMNVDALSNKTQNWSGNATGGQNVGRAFDGTGPRKDHYSHSATALTVNFSPAISGRIIVYGGTGGSGPDTYTLSDGSSLSSAVQYDTAPYFEALDFGVKSNITSLTCSNGYTLYGISLDGKMLVDSGSSANVPSIAPSGCSVGTKQGFSIIKYTGTDNASDIIPHGLTQEPDFAIFKNISQDGDDWIVYHSSQGATKRGKLNLTNAFDAQTSQFNDAGPTSSLFFIGTYDNINKLNNNYISYIWHDVPGLQKFGTFTAINSTNANFVELGFRPSIVWVKAASSAGDMTYASWLIADGERSSANPVDKALFANKNVAEGKRGNGSDNYTGAWLDILSNGFKIRYNGTEVNGVSGQTYIYCAWAEAPEFNLYGAQSNAR